MPVPRGAFWGVRQVPNRAAKNARRKAQNAANSPPIVYLWLVRIRPSPISEPQPYFALMSALRSSPIQVLGWAFCMVIFPVIPLSTVFILEPSWIHIVLLAVFIGGLAGLVGRMFED